jgi:hypothetical protein
MTGRAIEFEIFCIHLDCDVCHKPIHKGFMYMRVCVGCHRIDSDVYCDACCPTWLREAAIANRGTIPVRRVADPTPISPDVAAHAMTRKDEKECPTLS